ncbi:5'-nucleotidase [Carnimonas sp. R-84981]|uniref:HAD family hydrolase n=1 Tax=Carnimonas bestiolae TaxID=3402172 RepID=UPI003EDBC93B
MGYSLAIFDWDGTLMNSVPRIVLAMQRAAQDIAIDVFSDRQVRDIIGLGLPEAIAVLAPALNARQAEALRQRYIARFHEIAAKEPADCFFDGITSMLATLSHHGAQLAIATGKGMPGLKRALAAHPEQQQLFSALRTADVTRSKPDPLMLQQLLDETGVAATAAVMVGDSIYDMQMAGRAGVAAIGVGWGVHHAEQLLENGALRVAQSPQQLAEWLTAPAC